MTITWYNTHAEAFVKNTLHVDMDSLYQPFLSRLSGPSRILDLGCGSGRDTLHFTKLGHEVIAVEPSKSLAVLAERYTGQSVLNSPIAELELPPLDAVWACASLLHISAENQLDTLTKLFHALREKGILYCSYKLGVTERVEDGRYFFDTTPTALRDLLERAGFTVEQIWQTNDLRPEKKQPWVNALASKEGSTRLKE